MISPNDLHRAAQAHMLEGRVPKTEQDWAMCVNFWAANIEFGLEDVVCTLLGKIMDCPLSEEYIKQIVKFQVDAKKRNKRNERRHANGKG